MPKKKADEEHSKKKAKKKPEKAKMTKKKASNTKKKTSKKTAKTPPAGKKAQKKRAEEKTEIPRVSPCATRIKPMYDALPGWENKKSLKENVEKSGMTFWSFFDYDCGSFDVAQNILSKESDRFTEHDNIRFMIQANNVFFNRIRPDSLKNLIPSAKRPVSLRYSLVMAKDRNKKVAGSIHGFRAVVSGMSAIIILGSSHDGRTNASRELHQMLFCSLISSLLKGERLDELDYLIHALPYPRLEKEEEAVDALGRLMFLGRSFGFSIIPDTECGRFWIDRAPLMLGLRIMGKEEVPITKAEEIRRVVGMFYGAFLGSGIPNSDLVMESFEKAISKIPPDGNDVPLIILPRSPDDISRIRDLSDALAEAGSMKDRCENGYLDNPFCAEYLAVLKKKGISTSKKEILEVIKKKVVRDREDPTPARI
jgi:hypothetical protein